MCEVVAVVVSLGGGFLFSLVTRGFQCQGLNILTLPDAVPSLPTSGSDPNNWPLPVLEGAVSLHSRKRL